MAVAAHLRQLEERLLQPAVRHSVQEIESLLAEDFREFGSSGRAYSRPDILQALAAEAPRHLTLTEFRCHLPAPGVALVTYRSTSTQDAEKPTESLRSSVWVQRAGRWQVLFHQGTRVPQPSASETQPNKARRLDRSAQLQQSSPFRQERAAPTKLVIRPERAAPTELVISTEARSAERRNPCIALPIA